MAWDKKFPFVNGNMLNWDGGYHTDAKRLTLDEATFTGALKYLTYSRGRSSAMLVFTDGQVLEPQYEGQPESNRMREFSFFMSDSDKIIPMLVKGMIEGTFIPTKRGANFGWKIKD